MRALRRLAGKDVSSGKCGWDITFSRGREVVHAEVKGRSGKTPTVLLTMNETGQGEVADPRWRLVIVTQALIDPQVTVIAREESPPRGEPYVYRFTPRVAP